MKRFLVAPSQLAVLVAATAIGAVAYQGDTAAPNMASHIKHAPIQVHRNDDGSLARGRNNEIETSNWSGYAVAHFETGQSYTAAYATWTVPSVSYDSVDQCGSQPCSADYSSTWVGIGGFCENVLCTKGDRSLIQLGTEQDVSSAGVTTYYSWYELLPQFPVVMPNPVTPGDVITASLQCNGSCPSRKQSWTLTMSNSSPTHPWTWSVTVPYTSSKLSAEWIEEAPSSAGGVLPLADFGTATIDPTPSSVESSLSLATNGILMLDPWGQTANPSEHGSFGFNVCWGSGGAFKPCPTP